MNSDEYKDKVPAWLRRLTMPTTVVLYPIIVNKRCLGLIYADNDDSSIKISMEALGFFKTLRNQASLAIQQVKKIIRTKNRCYPVYEKRNLLQKQLQKKNISAALN